jgi:hypothetical protein
MRKNKISKEETRKLNGVFTHPVWTNLPDTIKILQNSRTAQTENGRIYKFPTICGINTSIILLSATCIEGFLVECLSLFTVETLITAGETINDRMLHDLRVRISRATFGDFQELFSIVLGKSLSELIVNEPLIECIQTLIPFRNGLAHGRSISFESYTDSETQTTETEIQQQYKVVYNYLIKNNLIIPSEHLIGNKVADHFAEQIFPFMNEVINVLPEKKKTAMDFFIALAKGEI